MSEIILMRNAPYFNGITELGKDLASQLDINVDLCIISPLDSVKNTLKHSNIIYKNLLISDLCLPKLDGNDNSYKNILSKKIETEEEFQNRVNLLSEYLKKKQIKYPRILLLTHECVLFQITGFYFKHCNYFTY
ncbi:hypothetical protein Hokovirus_1_194 [Hokovirus HKV1]|uniref:Uncharacterized protein n=1 Tax=Hokovirus HKV1 TaxID=1977638 RepID=A0A1V0SF20_9VIRU|nr:hypothetical protein Hokovirus_1_194 [Hokovirus HKV1]